MAQEKIRNVAIIAHVDHGKTTLVDQLFKFSGTFRENQDVEERLMDSMDLERERGITIMAKNGSCRYKGHLINIIDTPGHADFGGEVERVMSMADAVLFLVDAQEGPMPQSYFVLKKAVAKQLPVIVVVNKIDKPAARCDWVIDQVFDLLCGLDAPDEILDFPVFYASARDGVAKKELSDPDSGMEILLDAIIEKVPQPVGDAEGAFQFLISSISYSSFLGRLAVGKITSGSAKTNQAAVLATQEEGVLESGRMTKLYRFKANQHEEINEAECGEIVAIAGFENAMVGQTITDPNNPIPLETMPVDPPTISMNFLPNDSPFAGKEGEFVTSRQLGDRLQRELLTDVALQVSDLEERPGFKVSGRGELHLSILIEKMRREGYEFQVSRPTVIVKEIEGVKKEPYESLFVEVPEEHMGAVIESLGIRKGLMVHMEQDRGVAKLEFKIPTRGLLGYISDFMTQTKGLGVMNSRFLEYGDYVGVLRTRQNGVLVSKETGQTIAFALFNLQERGRLFLGQGVHVYEGQIIGENARDDDMVVNPMKGKKLTNMRASGSDESVILTPPVELSLEQCLSFITDEEWVECTPKEIRMRKIFLTESERKREKQR